MAFRPRKDRLINLAGSAADQARAAGETALEAAIAAIDAGFGDAYVHNDLKRRVEINLRRGANDIDVRIRYGLLVDRLLPSDCLATALLQVRRAVMIEREAGRRHLRQRGFTEPGARATRQRLAEAHLILRWLRAKGLAPIWPQVLESLSEDPAIRRPALFVIAGGRGYGPEFAEAAE